VAKTKNKQERKIKNDLAILGF
jgi:hypothetical protein